MIMYGQPGRTREEAAIAYFKVTCQYSPGGTEENHESPRSTTRDSKKKIIYKRKGNALVVELFCLMGSVVPVSYVTCPWA
jgi:hypothetical protein